MAKYIALSDLHLGQNGSDQKGQYSLLSRVPASLPGTGWRLPTPKELQTIVDYSQSNPSIDSTAFPGTPASLFWSSSPVAGSPSYAWVVSFSHGVITYRDVTNPYYVRCVR